ncbi:MAG: hypothetical protein WBF89_14520 [Steroidobacteraceae bacterium]
MVKHCLLVLALAATHAAAAPRAIPHAAADKFQTWRTAAAAALSAHTDANSLATAAALRYVGSANPKSGSSSKTDVPSKSDSSAKLDPSAKPDPSNKPDPSGLDLAARASELDPQSASISWLHLQLCAKWPACDIRDVATVMRWVDADNGAAWLQTLAAAQRDRDTTEVDRILADMAHGARFDFYWNRIVVMMVDVLDAAHDELPGGYAASDSARLSIASGIASGEIIPPFTALMEACRESNAAADRRDLCLKLSKTMQRGDTVIAQMAGFSIEKHLLAPDSKEARAIAERRHILEWRVAAAAKFDNPLLPWTKNARARARLMHMRAMAREEDVCIAILRQHNMALEPPEAHP